MSVPEPWQVAGSAPEIYERELVPAVFGPWATLLVDLAQLRGNDRVLDVACGTGIVSRVAAERIGTSGSITGLDLNPEMLRVAQTAWSTHMHSGVPIRWQEASADKLPYPNASFDVVFCQLGLQFFPDRPAALREMRRVLDTGGRLAVMVWRGIDESPGFAALADALERYVGSAAAAVMRAPFRLSDASELIALVQDAGFAGAWVQQRTGTIRFPSIERFVSSYVAGSPLAGLVAPVPGALGHLISDLAIALKRYAGPSGMEFPITAHLLRATQS